MGSSYMLVPRLRFREFLEYGEWEEKKLGEVCEIKTGNKDTQNKIDDGKYPFFVRSQKIERINSFSFDGEAILTSGDGVGVGKIYHYINGKFDFHQRVYCLYNYKDVFGIFLYYIFSIKFYKHVILLSAKNSVDSVRRSMITDFKLPFPNIQEQTAIANFLQNLDNRIEKQTALIEKQKTLKKAYLQKLFPKNGKTVPQMRFKEFLEYGEWEEKKLGDVCETITDYVASGSFASIRYNVTYLSNANFAQLVRTKDLKHEFKNNDFVYVDEEAFKFLKKVNLNEDSIILPNIGANIGESYFIDKNSLPYSKNVLGPNSILIRCYKNSIKFIYFYFSKYIFYTQLNEISSSTGQPKFNKTDLKKIEFNLPTPPEQTAIANFLQNLDKCIEKSEQILQLYKKEKKAYLQKLFV